MGLGDTEDDMEVYGDTSGLGCVRTPVYGTIGSCTGQRRPFGISWDPIGKYKV